MPSIPTPTIICRRVHTKFIYNTWNPFGEKIKDNMVNWLTES